MAFHIPYHQYENPSSNQWLEQDLLVACENGEYQAVEMLLGHHELGVLQRDRSGRTPLLWACIYGWMTIVILLFNRGANVNDQDHKGWSALMLACRYQYKNVNVVKVLIDYGAAVNMTDSNKFSALMAASEVGNEPAVELLVQQSAEINMQNKNGWSALMLASRNGHINVVRCLIERGANVNLENNNGWSALMIACLNGHSNVVVILIENNATVNTIDNKGQSALTLASDIGHTSIVQILIESGAVDVQDRNMMSAQNLISASENGHLIFVKMLIEKEANLNVNLQNRNGWSALMLASRNGYSDVVKVLLQEGAEVNMRNKNGWSALIIASFNGHTNIVKILIENSATVNLCDDRGQSALIVASYSGHPDVVRVLIEKDAEVNSQDNNGWTALMAASRNGHNDVVKVLVENGADMTILNDAGKTALMMGCMNGKTKVVQVLLDHHADTSVQDATGKTAFDWASMRENAEIVHLLSSLSVADPLPRATVETHLTSNCSDIPSEINEGPVIVAANDSEPSTDEKSALDLQIHTVKQEEHNVTESPLTVTELSNRDPCLPSDRHEDVQNINGASDSRDQLTGLLQSSKTVINEPSSDHNNDVQSRCTESVYSQSCDVLQDQDLPELSLEVLYKELRTVSDPIQLGICLGLPSHCLEIIKRNNPQDVDQQKRDVLSFIAKNYIPMRITWERIAETLEYFMHMRNLARDIRKKFVANQRHVEGESPKEHFCNKVWISNDLVIFTDQRIGTGAFGAVFKGEFSGKLCAIKVLHAVASELQTQLPTANYAKKESLTTFCKECDFLQSFNHPNIVHHLATREHSRTRQLILALELMDCNLRYYFTPQPNKELVKLELPVQSSLCRDIASALEYIHSQGVIHRDLCGENILLSCRGEVPIAKVCDFGMSRITKSDTRSVSFAFGHKGFMPPEATDMESIGYNSKFDIYSFGALMIQIVRHLPTIKDRKERKRELELIPEDHPIKELILDCLNDNRDDRPSAIQLKRRFPNQAYYWTVTV